MTGIDEGNDIHLDAARFANDKETFTVASAVARHAEKRRADYRKSEKPIDQGLPGGEVYWSETVPWSEWMSEPQILQPCAKECGLQIWQLADVIAYQIQPSNWQVFCWMGMALQNAEHEKHFVDSLVNHASIISATREQQRERASHAGRASGESRRDTVRCTPEQVAKGYQTLMATGTESRYVASILAQRFGVTADHIRQLHKKAAETKRD
jgi:hypothetical protein